MFILPIHDFLSLLLHPFPIPFPPSLVKKQKYEQQTHSIEHFDWPFVTNQIGYKYLRMKFKETYIQRWEVDNICNVHRGIASIHIKIGRFVLHLCCICVVFVYEFNEKCKNVIRFDVNRSQLKSYKQKYDRKWNWKKNNKKNFDLRCENNRTVDLTVLCCLFLLF